MVAIPPPPVLSVVGVVVGLVDLGVVVEALL